tara:strand:- start:253 stop:909 length:657 start_codon:yes stop_codon:yes gene_type:complete
MFKSKKPDIVQGYLVDEDGKEYTMDKHGVKIEIPKAKVVPIKATDVKFSDLPPMYSYNAVVVEAYDYEKRNVVTPILNSVKPDELKFLKILKNNTKITVFPNNKHRLNNSMTLVHVEDGTWGYLEDKFIVRNPGGGSAMSAAGGTGTAAGSAMSAGDGGDTSSDTSPTPMRGGGRKLKRKSSRKRSNKRRSNRKRSNRRKSNKRRSNRKRTNKRRSRR